MATGAAILCASLLLSGPGSGNGEKAPHGGLAPDEAQASFRIDPRFRIELSASEPAVADPVSVAWDERGRMWVTEMPDYPLGPPGGRVRFLVDADGDGRYERSQVFAEGLPFPTSALPHEGGLLVSATPDILFLKDTDGDGRADLRRVVLTGFHPGNTQLRVNGLRRGLDGWIHAANGRSGGKARRPEDPPESGVDLGERDLRFDPDTFLPEAISGPSQFGHAFDSWGRRFLSWNTVHIRQDILSPRDLERHPRLLRTATVAPISDHGDSARIYPLSPPPKTFNNEPTDHHNASCGLTVERGGLFPAGYSGNAYVCEPLVGIVHRDRLEPGPGPALVARRGEEGTEFLASTDPWFHPVNLRNGPDGALYLVDFYRELVEHPEYVPKEIRGGIDYTRGRGHGRIWRILPRDARPFPVEDLGTLPSRDLVGRLESPNGEVRDTAERLLLERRDPLALEPLRSLARGSALPLARVHALWSLRRLGALEAGTLAEALEHPEPRLREAALRVAREEKGLLSVLAHRIVERAADGDPAVRFQAVLALGDFPPSGEDSQLVPALARSAERDGGDRWFQAGVASSLRGREAAFIEARMGSGPGEGAGEALLGEAAELAGAEGDPAAELRILAAAASGLAREPPTAAFLLAGGLARGLRRAGSPAPRTGGGHREEAAPRWDRLFASGLRIASDSGRDPGVRAAAAALLAYAPFEEALPVLADLLDPRRDLEVQRSAARALSGQASPRTAGALLSAWGPATPAVRAVLFDGLLSRPERLAALFEAVERGEVGPRDLDPVRREALRRALDPPRRKRLEGLLAPAASDRSAVIERYRESALGGGDPERGREVYRKTCAPCHRFGGAGHAVGPDLSGAGKKRPEELLVAILDPNRSVVEGYTAYTVTTASGETLTGILASETGNAITLRRAEGIEETVARASIRSILSAGTSLMPDGIEASLSPADAADLLEHLRRN